MLMTFLGMKLKVTQKSRRKERVCRMLPFPYMTSACHKFPLQGEISRMRTS